MLRCLTLIWVRRVVVAMVLGTFVPVASATIACQVHCATQSATALHAAAAGAHPQDADHGTSGWKPTFDRYLTHGGPCHLATVPGVVAARSAAPTLDLQPGWLPTPMAACIAFVGPPPEHRPRA